MMHRRHFLGSLATASLALVAPRRGRAQDARGRDKLFVFVDALGWRLVDMEGSSRGSNPVRGQVVVAWESGGVAASLQVEAPVTGDRSHLPLSLPGDATAVTVTDVYGNAGTLP